MFFYFHIIKLLASMIKVIPEARALN